MIRVTITQETHHGKPGEKRVLPVGASCFVTPATNLPVTSKIKYWAQPANDRGPSGWPEETAQWALDVGVGLYGDEFELASTR